MTGIYCIRLEDRFYVGQAKNILVRFKDHRCKLRHGRHNPKFQRAWDKYGEKAFQFEIIEICELERLTECEQYWSDTLDSVDSGFNCGKFVDNPKRGTKLSAETRRKISAGNRGKRLSNETRQLLSDVNRGKTLSDETRKKISEGNRGKKRSETVCRRLSEVNSGKTIPDEVRQKISETLTGRKQELSEEEHKRRSERMKGNTLMRGRKLSEETKQKMSEAHQNPSDEVKRNVSEGVKRWWAERKARLQTEKGEQ